jgi:hypothetical protein
VVTLSPAKHRDEGLFPDNIHVKRKISDTGMDSDVDIGVFSPKYFSDISE